MSDHALLVESLDRLLNVGVATTTFDEVRHKFGVADATRRILARARSSQQIRRKIHVVHRRRRSRLRIRANVVDPGSQTVEFVAELLILRLSMPSGAAFEEIARGKAR